MFKKINERRKQQFKKRHFILTLKSVVEYCTAYFKYKLKPCPFETKNPPNVLMWICRSWVSKKKIAIFYDYKMFKKEFGHLDFDGQLAYATLLIAHEMRHYYQMRQIDSFAPGCGPALVEEWRKDEDSPQKKITDKHEQLEFYKTPMELDAQLFGYCFVAEYLGMCVSQSYISDDYVNVLEEYYVKLHGKTNKEWFSQKNT